MKLYVGNLSWNVDEGMLRTAFAAHGNVDEAVVVMDRDSGRSRGFGFVTMSDDKDANDAIEALNDQELDGRVIKVNEARAKTSGGGGGYKGGGGGYKDRDSNYKKGGW